MKFVLIVAALAAAALNVQGAAGFKHDIQSRHRDIGRSILEARAVSGKNTVKSNKNRCKKKVTSSDLPKSSSKAKTSTKKAASTKTSKATTTKTSSDSPKSGVIRVQSSCGNIGATQDIQTTSGPNGAEGWLNCGLTGGGWRPPNVHVKDLVFKSLDAALATPGNPFGNCHQYLNLFEKYGNQYGIPPIFIASFAMQESSCNAYISNGGLMQITADKCGGAPGGKCNDPDFNVRVGTKYFADVLSRVGGNVLQAVGEYNGWQPGMTKDQVLGRSSCQQNLDYMQQFFNGWIQAIDPYSRNLGMYHNGGGCAS